jgi:maltooligosyltrehalose trehalohydrolase
MYGDRLSTSVTPEQKKLIAGAVLFSPFIPLLFMGEEYAEENPFLYFTSHRGRELIKMVREGRRKEFNAFLKEGKAPDPQDQRTFEKSKLKYSKLEKHEKALFKFYKNLILLRKTIPLWKSMERKNFSAESLEGKKVLQLTRKNNYQILLAILNFEDSEVNVITCKPYIQWELLLNSSDKQWGGPGNYIDPEKPSISVPPHTMIILYSS